MFLKQISLYARAIFCFHKKISSQMDIDPFHLNHFLSVYESKMSPRANILSQEFLAIQWQYYHWTRTNIDIGYHDFFDLYLLLWKLLMLLEILLWRLCARISSVALPIFCRGWPHTLHSQMGWQLSKQNSCRSPVGCRLLAKSLLVRCALRQLSKVSS